MHTKIELLLVVITDHKLIILVDDCEDPESEGQRPQERPGEFHCPGPQSYVRLWYSSHLWNLPGNFSHFFLFYSGKCACCRVLYDIDVILNRFNNFCMKKSWKLIVNYNTQKIMYYCIPHLCQNPKIDPFLSRSSDLKYHLFFYGPCSALRNTVNISVVDPESFGPQSDPDPTFNSFRIRNRILPLNRQT